MLALSTQPGYINRNITINISTAMGNSNMESFEPDDVRMAALAKAIAHPARIAIINLLLEQQHCICGSLVDQLPLSQSTVSQHLKELKEVGIIHGEIEGARVCYCINPEVWESTRTLFASFFKDLTTTSRCC